MTRKNPDCVFAEELWHRYAESIMRTLFSYEADAQLREDLAQDVFLALLNSVSAVMNAENEKAYVFRIVHNVAVDHIAKAVKQRTDYLEPNRLNELQDAQRVSAVPSPAAHVSKNQQREQLLRAVSQMSAPNRQVIALLLEDFSQHEIADILLLRGNTVRVRINRAKAELRRLLGPHGS